MQQLLADGEPHTFAEIYILLAGVLRSDDAIRTYSRENPKLAAQLSEETVIERGKLRLTAMLLNDMTRYGMMTSTGKGLTRTYQWVFDKATKESLCIYRRKSRTE